jgi:DNA-directed RNA polymerase specialized sigma24 family protein
MSDNKKTGIKQEEFEKFLNFLNADREIAGQKYESIRLRLIKIFYARGCPTAEELADKSIDVVIKKIDKIAETYKGDLALYFYGVAKKIFLEFLAKPKLEELPEIIVQPETDTEKVEKDHQCLTKCLNELSSEQRMLITGYYMGERRIKIERRKELEKELGITNKALRVRAFRIRRILEECIQNCVKQNSDETF